MKVVICTTDSTKVLKASLSLRRFCSSTLCYEIRRGGSGCNPAPSPSFAQGGRQFSYQCWIWNCAYNQRKNLLFGSTSTKSTIHILRKHFHKSWVFSSKQNNFFFHITFWRDFHDEVWNFQYITHCNCWMGTDLLRCKFTPHYSDMLFRWFLSKICLCRLNIEASTGL